MKIFSPWQWFTVSLILVVASQTAQAGQITGRLLLNGSPIQGAQISFRTPVSPFMTWGGFSPLADGAFETDNDLPTGSFQAATFVDSFVKSNYLGPYLNGIPVVSGQTTNIGDVEVLHANRSISGTVGGTAYAPLVNITSTATIGGVEYRVWSTPDETTRGFTIPAVDGTWTIVATYHGTVLGEAVVTVNGSNLAGVLLDTPPASAYTNWAYSYGLFASAAFTDANPDGDEFSNQTEFAFGTDPSKITAALTTTSRSGNQLTVSWLERSDSLYGYFVRESSDLQVWQAAAGIAVQNGSVLPAPPSGYVRKQFTTTAAGRKFFRVLSTDTPQAVPDQSFNITVAGETVNVERWGTGSKAVIMFGYVPFTMQQDLKASSGASFSSLVGSEYSMFLWTYPDAGPFSQADAQIDAYFNNVEAALANRLDFTGYASSIVSQIRATTGLSNVCLVGNSFGAGVVMWDLAALSADPNVRFVLISPTEVFMPYLNLLPVADPLPRTQLISDAWNDFYIYSQTAYDYIDLRTTGLPPGYNAGVDFPHFIIGVDATPLSYVFNLINAVYQQP